IENAAYTAQREIEEGRRVVVGVNAFREEQGTASGILSVDPAIEREQVERLRAFRASRDAAASRSALDALRRDASEDRNLMPALVETVSPSVARRETVSTRAGMRLRKRSR